MSDQAGKGWRDLLTESAAPCPIAAGKLTAAGFLKIRTEICQLVEAGASWREAEPTLRCIATQPDQGRPA